MAQTGDDRASLGYERKPNFAPVQRYRAESYVLIVLVSLAGSVIGTRLFLELTGYPQLGGETLHIAHAIWGGLLLYVAALLPLILANEWAQTASAVLNGMGAGLFIDEVGKFITRDLDYFYPPAAPLVYAFFLLSVLLYRFVRRYKPEAPRSQLYHALEGMQEVLDGDLDQKERERVLRWLNAAGRSNEPELARLATGLSVYLRDPNTPVYPVKPTWWSHFLERLEEWGRRLGRSPHRLAVLLTMAALVIAAGIDVFRLILTAVQPSPFRETLNALLLQGGSVRDLSDVTWYLLRVGLDAGVGLAALAALIMTVTRGEDTGTRMAILALAFSLTTVTLLNFYLDQFGAVLLALAQLGGLLLILLYRQWYILPAVSRAQARPPATL
jgi:hypothetical protein